MSSAANSSMRLQREFKRSAIPNCYCIPDPPRITQQTADSLIDDAVIEIESSDNGSPDQKIWMATGTFQVADHPIHTRMAMVWCPRVWKRLATLVNGSSNGGNG